MTHGDLPEYGLLFLHVRQMATSAFGSLARFVRNRFGSLLISMTPYLNRGVYLGENYTACLSLFTVFALILYIVYCGVCEKVFSFLHLVLALARFTHKHRIDQGKHHS